MDITLLEKLPADNKEIVLLHHNNKKIRDFNNADFQKLCFTLLKTCFELGNPKPPTPFEIINWCITIGEEYKDFSIPEISKAIKLCLVGKLYIFEKEYKKVDIGNFHFKPFIIICEILTAYREYRKEKMKLHNRNVSEKLQQIESEKIKLENFKKFKTNWINTLNESFIKYKSTGIFLLKDANLSYFKRIYSSKFYILTDSELDFCKEKAKQKISLDEPKDIYNNNLPFTVFNKLKNSRSENLIRAKTSELALQMLFDKWIEKKIPIKTIINSIQFNYEK